MELVKDNWTAKDIKRPDKIEFSKKTVNTEMNVLGIDCPTCKNIAKKIHEGNFISFLEKNDFKYYENTQVSAYLINYIKDVNEKIVLKALLIQINYN